LRVLVGRGAWALGLLRHGAMPLYILRCSHPSIHLHDASQPAVIHYN
jgi:hypothetical protein